MCLELLNVYERRRMFTIFGLQLPCAIRLSNKVTLGTEQQKTKHVGTRDMALSLGVLIEACLLFVNAIAILDDQRFLEPS